MDKTMKVVEDKRLSGAERSTSMELRMLGIMTV